MGGYSIGVRSPCETPQQRNPPACKSKGHKAKYQRSSSAKELASVKPLDETAKEPNLAKGKNARKEANGSLSFLR